MKLITLLFFFTTSLHSFCQSDIFDTIIVSQKRSVYLYFDNQPKIVNDEVVGMNILTNNNDVTFGVYANIPDSTFVTIKINDIGYKFCVLQTLDTLLKYQYYYKTNPDQRLVKSFNNDLANNNIKEVAQPKVKRKREASNQGVNNGFNNSFEKKLNETRIVETTHVLDSNGNQLSINAVVDNDNIKVFTGSSFNIRINEDFVIAHNLNQRNKIVTGNCIIENGRLFITVKVYQGDSYYEYEVYGLDDLKGVDVAGGNKRDKVKSAVIKDGYKVVLKLKK